MQQYFLALIILLSTTFNVYSAGNIDCSKRKCIAVINAGSTGSRLYIYTYELDHTKTPINITEVWNNSIKPGLSSLKPQSSSIFPYLNELLAEMPDYNGRVFLYATAGMRLNSKKNNSVVYSLIRTWFKEKKNLNLVEARTIHGEEEGIFGWLAINYKLKRLNQNSKPFVDVIDIGGASTQIAFSLTSKSKEIKNISNVYSFTLYGQHLKIASYSFLGLGENELLSEFKEYSPCYAQGYSLSPEIKGKGDMPQCIQSISKKINTYPLKEVKTLVANYAPKEWYLIGGITNMFRNTKLTTNDKFTNQEFAAKSEQQLCQTPWSKLKNEYKEDKLPMACGTSSYVYSLLVNGYGISIKEPIYLMPTDSNVDWSVGVVFAHP